MRILYYPIITLCLAIIPMLIANNAHSQSPTLYLIPAVFRDCPDCPRMAAIPTGTYEMGSSAEDYKRDLSAIWPDNATLSTLFPFWPTELNMATSAMHQEQPQHQVIMEHAFAMGINAVSKSEFASFVNETGYIATSNCAIMKNTRYFFPNQPEWETPGFLQASSDPVVCVSWDDANAYILWLNAKKDGENHKVASQYRLPTEAEWEYSARAGTTTARWWGNLPVQGIDCNQCTPSELEHARRGSDLGLENPNGLYNLLGYAWEWTQDCWHENYIGAPSDGKAWQAGKCDRRSLRGGGWGSSYWNVRSAARIGFDPIKSINTIGFRIARDL